MGAQRGKEEQVAVVRIPVEFEPQGKSIDQNFLDGCQGIGIESNLYRQITQQVFIGEEFRLRHGSCTLTVNIAVKHVFPDHLSGM